MPNGMGEPVDMQGMKQMSTTKEGRVTSVHTVPVEQFIHSIEEDGSCLCGPTIEYLGGETITLQVTHFALDPKYYEGWHWDWGPDGPGDS